MRKITINKPRTSPKAKVESEEQDRKYERTLLTLFMLFGTLGLIFVLINGIVILALPLGSAIPIYINYTNILGVFFLGISGIILIAIWIFRKRCTCA